MQPKLTLTQEFWAIIDRNYSLDEQHHLYFLALPMYARLDSTDPTH